MLWRERLLRKQWSPEVRLVPALFLCWSLDKQENGLAETRAVVADMAAADRDGDARLASVFGDVSSCVDCNERWG